MENGGRPVRTSVLTQQKVISYDEDNCADIQDPHHDGVVITLFISNHFVRSILIDGKSSVKIIQLDVLDRMDILESDIVQRSSILGETKITLGDTKLPIYIEGVNYVKKIFFMLLIAYLAVTLSLAGHGYTI